MSATRKSTNAAKKATTRKATTRKATTRKAATRRSSTSRRRTSTTRRSQPKVATTVGAALGTLVVSLLLDASWPVRIGLVLLALLLVGGYLYVQGRRHDAGQPVAESAPPDGPTPPSPDTPAAPTTPEDTP